MRAREEQVTLGNDEDGKVTYVLRRLPATTAIRVEAKVAQLIGEPLFKAFASGQQAPSPEAGLAAGIGLLARTATDQELLDLMKTCFEHVGVKDKCIRITGENCAGFDEAFANRSHREPWSVLLAFLKFNFADFFVGNLSLSALRSKVMGSSQSNPPTSTGG